jgi:hypothetical protein
LKPEVQDRTALWLPLVQRLTEASTRWTIWKNADAAFAGSGDIDSAAPIGDWDLIVGEFRQWAAEHGLGPVIDCRHPPKTMFLLALDRSGRTLLELDVSGRKYFRGWTLFRAEDLRHLTQMDGRGFRRLRPGAEGLILLLGNGLRWGGRLDPGGIRKRRIPELLEEDREGVREASRAFGLPMKAVDSAVDSLVAGSWGRRSMLLIESWAMLQALTEPSILLARARFRLSTKRRCPVLRSVFYADRRIQGDLDLWLREVERGHAVYRNGLSHA